MSVRAKMTCTLSKKQPEYPENHEVVLSAVYTNDPGDPNHSWSKYTPSGEIKMIITNPAAYAQFELGKTYWVDFTPVE